MGFKASSRKIPQDTFSNVGRNKWGGKQRDRERDRRKKKKKNKGKACCIFRPPCVFFAFTDLAIATLIPKKYNTGNDETLQKKCVEPHKQSTFWCYIYTHRTHPVVVVVLLSAVILLPGKGGVCVVVVGGANLFFFSLSFLHTKQIEKIEKQK